MSLVLFLGFGLGFGLGAGAMGYLKARYFGVLVITCFRLVHSCRKTGGVAYFARDDFLRSWGHFYRAGGRQHTLWVLCHFTS